MKHLLLLSFLIFFVISGCGNEDKSKLEVFNAEAFAFDVGDYYEVNASTRVKGFQQNENGERFTASISYDVHIVTPAGDTLKSLISKTDDKEFDEEQMDIPIEAQLELDSAYSAGNYKLIFEIKDINTDKTAFASADFKLE